MNISKMHMTISANISRDPPERAIREAIGAGVRLGEYLSPWPDSILQLAKSAEFDIPHAVLRGVLDAADVLRLVFFKCILLLFRLAVIQIDFLPLL
jgi:hypothetical protein